jgi:hypothetical protein
MNREAKFSTLPQHKQFQFLYYCVKVNQGFLISWLKNKVDKYTSPEDGYCVTVFNSVDFLKKVLFSTTDVIRDKEIMLNGLADDIAILIDELSEIPAVSGRFKALAALKLLKEVYAILIDVFFGAVLYDLNYRSLQIILMGALISNQGNRYDLLIPNITNTVRWTDLTDLEIAHPGVMLLLDKFMDELFILLSKGPGPMTN